MSDRLRAAAAYTSLPKLQVGKACTECSVYLDLHAMVERHCGLVHANVFQLTTFVNHCYTGPFVLIMKYIIITRVVQQFFRVNVSSQKTSKLESLSVNSV